MGKVEYNGLNDIPEVFSITQKVFPGTVVVDDGTTRQEALVVKLHSTSMDEAVDVIHRVQDCVHIYDVKGDSMLFEAFDASRLNSDW